MNEISFYDTSVWLNAEYDLMAEVYKKNLDGWYDDMPYTEILSQLDEHEIMDRTMVREYLDTELKHTEVYELAVSEAEFLNDIITDVGKITAKFVKRYKDTGMDNRYAGQSSDMTAVLQMLNITVCTGAYSSCDMNQKLECVHSSLSVGLHNSKVYHNLSARGNLDKMEQPYEEDYRCMMSAYRSV